MPRLIRAALCIALLQPTNGLLAATVFRCEDAQGHISYTLHGCPQDASQTLQAADNPPPGTGRATPLAKPRKSRQQKADRQAPPLTVVGTRQDGCGNKLTNRERRRAIIRQQIRGGMTRNDVENALGKPDRISGKDGQTRYHYADEKGNRRQVAFDESGCVQEKKKR